MRFVIRNRKKIEEKLGAKFFTSLLLAVSSLADKELSSVEFEEEGKRCVSVGEFRFAILGITWDVVRLAYFPKTEDR